MTATLTRYRKKTEHNYCCNVLQNYSNKEHRTKTTATCEPPKRWGLWHEVIKVAPIKKWKFKQVTFTLW